ncbi:unnamed protein product [Protopolystoma xenopodis]|uniref:Uncharacterized protein n=1 Tax=Protopolystoma xenopodis TaxID=117903 RepID=A0A3S5AEF2_9PLAT|nr:unnamed protein product [Protopolystoma xenopodis]
MAVGNVIGSGITGAGVAMMPRLHPARAPPPFLRQETATTQSSISLAPGDNDVKATVQFSVHWEAEKEEEHESGDGELEERSTKDTKKLHIQKTVKNMKDEQELIHIEPEDSLFNSAVPSLSVRLPDPSSTESGTQLILSAANEKAPQQSTYTDTARLTLKRRQKLHQFVHRPDAELNHLRLL